MIIIVEVGVLGNVGRFVCRLFVVVFGVGCGLIC